MKNQKITPANIQALKKNEVFVFGSNLNGNHAGGAARLAQDKFGAVDGKYFGLHGQSFAIPSLDESMAKINLKSLQCYVNDFLEIASSLPKKHFYVTEIGCGIAGFTHNEIAPLFKELQFIDNISLPQSFIDIIKPKKGFKVTDENMQCNPDGKPFQYELNKIYTIKGLISTCNWGFHYCEELNDCFNYYSFDPNNRVFEIIDHGVETKTNRDKSCTSSIELVKELSWLEVLKLVNSGKGNSGRSNAGNDNAGNDNAGNDNAGNRNAGYSNAGNDNAGAFNNLQANYMLFNKPSNWTYEDFINSTAFGYLQQVNTTIWVSSYQMTDEEKKSYPYHVTTGGFNRVLPYKEAFKNSWNNWSETARQSFKDLPNFDALVFEEITGISV